MSMYLKRKWTKDKWSALEAVFVLQGVAPPPAKTAGMGASSGRVFQVIDN